MHRVWAYWVVRCGRLAPLAALLLLALPSLARAQLACGGHYIDYIGAPPPRAAFPEIDQHGPPTVPTPPEMTAQDRELWDALIFDSFDHPTPSPDANDHRSSLPLEERHTRVMGLGDATSFRLCVQSRDESYTGQRLDRYADPAWWREQVQRFTNNSWAGTLETGTCTGNPPNGWVYVREGKPGEVDDDALAQARSWRQYNPHGSGETWIRSEIIWHSEERVRGTDEAWFESSLAHELGHVLGLSHVPPDSGFVMLGGNGHRTWPDKERWLSQYAHHVGPGIKHPGFALPVTAIPLVGLGLLAVLLIVVGRRRLNCVSRASPT